MDKLISDCKIVGKTHFPKFMGERHYMVKFFKEKGLPEHLTRFQNTIDGMLENIDTIVDGVSQPIFITVDEKVIKSGDSHRRGGVHIDGYWDETLKSHRGSGGHKMFAGWGTSNWKTNDFSLPESIVLASSVSASKGWVGEYANDVGEKGDCTHLDLTSLKSFMLQPNKVYRGNVTFLHESLPVDYDTERALIRLNIKNC